MSNIQKHFGTDGIRGKVGGIHINPEFIIKLGWAFGRVLSKKYGKSTVLVGKDTRISGYMLESSLEAGLSSAGVDIKLLGPMPTPAISYLTKTLRAQAGIVISASHNLFQDNGIKFFGSDGRKLSDSLELEIESELDKKLEAVDSINFGRAIRIVDAAGRYIEFCKSTVPSKFSLRGLKIVVDCANGATYHIAPDVFTELGADVITMGNEPNGLNINDKCGATDTKALVELVLHEKADVGLALDGDGDRVIMVDGKGEVLDGDDIVYIIAKHYHKQDKLQGGVVGTVMSNLGLEQALAKLDIGFIRSRVGDRYVIEELVANDWSLGGEPSGHVINFNYNETGDGIIAALQVLNAMKAEDKSLYTLKEGLVKCPNILVNVKVKDGKKILANENFQKEVKYFEKKLENKGRLLIRRSGTEPVIRVMVEGDDHKEINKIAETLAEHISKIDR